MARGYPFRVWDAEETAWAYECWEAGETVREIAQAATRSVYDVAWFLGIPVDLDNRSDKSYRTIRDMKQTSYMLRDVPNVGRKSIVSGEAA